METQVVNSYAVNLHRVLSCHDRIFITGALPGAEEPVGLGNRRLQIDCYSPFFTVFLTHSGAMGLQIRQKLSSLGPIFAFDAPSPTGS